MNTIDADWMLATLNDALAALRASAARAGRALRNVASQAPRAARAPQINRALTEAEQMLLSPEGLTGRPWYKHTIFAPGSYAGYAAVTLPGIREAAARGDWETARRETTVLAAALRRAAARLDQSARLASAP